MANWFKKQFKSVRKRAGTVMPLLGTGVGAVIGGPIGAKIGSTSGSMLAGMLQDKSIKGADVGNILNSVLDAQGYTNSGYSVNTYNSAGMLYNGWKP